MRAGPERLAGVDHDVERCPAGGRPRRANAQPVAEHKRLVELAPALGPVVGDLARRDLDERLARGGLEVGQRRQLAGRAVDRVLDDPVTDVDLLDAAGRQLEQLGEHQLGVLARDPDRESDQPPKARLSLPNTPSSVRRLSSVMLSERRWSSSR